MQSRVKLCLVVNGLLDMMKLIMLMCFIITSPHACARNSVPFVQSRVFCSCVLHVLANFFDVITPCQLLRKERGGSDGTQPLRVTRQKDTSAEKGVVWKPSWTSLHSDTSSTDAVFADARPHSFSAHRHNIMASAPDTNARSLAYASHSEHARPSSLPLSYPSSAHQGATFGNDGYSASKSPSPMQHVPPYHYSQHHSPGLMRHPSPQRYKSPEAPRLLQASPSRRFSGRNGELSTAHPIASTHSPSSTALPYDRPAHEQLCRARRTLNWSGMEAPT